MYIFLKQTIIYLTDVDAYYKQINRHKAILIFLLKLNSL